MTHLRIGFVLDDSLDRPDGVQQYVLTVGEWLRSEGHDVYYLVGNTTRHDIEGLRTLSRNWRVRFNHNAMSIPRPAPRIRIRHVLEELQLDVLHVQMPYHPLLAGRVIREASDHVAVVGTFHILPASLTAKLGTKALATVQAQTHARFDEVISVSDAAQEFAHSHYRLTSQVIPNTIELTKFAHPIVRDPTHTTIVFLGRLVRRKGAQYLLQALAHLRRHDKLQNVQIIIGGKGELSDDLERYVRHKGLDSITKFIGFVDEADKAALLGSADIAVFPSVSGESFGIVLIEAMAAGSGVVIGGDNPGYRSVLGNIPKTLIKPTQTKQFAALIEKLIGDDKATKRIHDLQQKLVKQYDIGVVGPQILDVYQRSLAKRRA